MPSELIQIEQLKTLRDSVTRALMLYKFGMDEILTKINILRQEFNHVHDYNPIENVSSRLKTPESILNKLQRKNARFNQSDLEKHVRDIAGIRVTTSFISDVFRIRDLLLAQQDITLIQEVDYVNSPKPNGYASLHLIIKVPVFLSSEVRDVMVEVQIRTIAMDFWASLEHKIYYKYQGEVPAELTEELKSAADIAHRLDAKMESLHNQVVALKNGAGAQPAHSLFGLSVADTSFDQLVKSALEFAASDPDLGFN